MYENVILFYVLPVLSIAMFLIFLRLYFGKNLMDKVIALDLLVIVGIGFFSAYAILIKRHVIIDVSLIIALIAFLSTVAFVYYYEKKGRDKYTSDEDENLKM